MRALTDAEFAAREAIGRVLKRWRAGKYGSRARAERAQDGAPAPRHRPSPMDGLAPLNAEAAEREEDRRARLRRDGRSSWARTKGDRWKAAVGLAGYAGLRLGEVRGLRWVDVDFDENLIHVVARCCPTGRRRRRRPKPERGPSRCCPRCVGCWRRGSWALGEREGQRPRDRHRGRWVGAGAQPSSRSGEAKAEAGMGGATSACRGIR